MFKHLRIIGLLLYYWDNYEKIFEQIEKSFSPKYHLLGYDFSVVCRPVSLKAKNSRIPTGSIQHGTVNYNLIPFTICEQGFFWEELAYQHVNTNLKNTEIYYTGSPNPAHFSQDSRVNLAYMNYKGQILQPVFWFVSGPDLMTQEGHKANINVLQKLIVEQRISLYN
ncbi:MAG: hypothetical protein IPN76_30175 [Saprospiraceae bacterium]|nr:hypothetical protein [Saprospiraceae bacterium]